MPPENTMRDIGFDVPMEGRPVRPAAGRYFIFAIAIDHYDEFDNNGTIPESERFNKLNNPVLDADRVLNVLLNRYQFHRPAPENGRKMEGYDREIIEYNTLQTKCLYNQNAKRENIQNHLKDIKEQPGGMQPNDCLLIYYAGHGMKMGNNAYAVPFDGKKKDEGSWFDFGNIFRTYFTEQTNCLDLLLILDACYAGAAAGGLQNKVSEQFWSRFVLTSATVYDKAYDGDPGVGSPFARALTNILENNTAPFAIFDKNTLSVEFEQQYNLQLGKKPEQMLVYEPLPTTYGNGEFVFELREKEKPPIPKLRETILDHLDFQPQRGELSEQYVPGLNFLNIITTRGNSFNVQKLLAKIIFKWIFTDGAVPYEPGANYIATPIQLNPGITASIWESLYLQIKGEQDLPLHNEPRAIFSWYFEKLLDTGEDFSGRRHVILWIGFNYGSKQVFERIDSFCKDWTTFFLEKRAALSPLEQAGLGKFFIVFSDDRNVTDGLTPDNFTFSDKSKINLIVTSRPGDINQNHVASWKNKVIAAIDATKIQAMKNSDPFSPEAGAVTYRYTFEEFVNELIKYLEFNPDESKQLNEFLYDFKPSLF